MQPINTFFDGHYFRSRLEARWAVFFKEAGISYQYEPEGFKLDNSECYLPDFYIPQFKAYAEIKPFTNDMIDVNIKQYITGHSDYQNKWFPFSRHYNLMLLFDVPHSDSFVMLTLGSAHGKISIKDYYNFPGNNLDDAILKANYKRFEHGAK